MILRSLTCLVLWITSQHLFAQPDWVNRIGSETGESYQGFAADVEGNYYVSGIYSNSLTLDGITITGNISDLYMAKFDKNGNILWLKGESSEAYYAVYDLVTTTDGGYVLSGIYYNADAQFGNTTLTNDAIGNPFLARYDNAGNLLWARGESGSANYNQLAVDHSGNIIFLGEINDPFIFDGEEQIQYGDRDIIFGKYGADGTPLWIKVLPAPDLEYASRVAVDADNNILITGRFFSAFSFEGTSFPSYGNDDAFILKTDADGSPIWVNVIGDDGNNRMPAGLGVADNGHIYLAISADDGMYVDAFTITTLGLTDMCLMELDPVTGAVNWYQTGGGYDWDYVYDLEVGSEGVFVCGTVNSDAEFGGLQLLTPSTCGYLVGYNFEGVSMEVTPFTSTTSAYAYDLTCDERGGVLVAGTFYGDVTVPGFSTVYAQGASDIFICKVSSILVDVQNHPLHQFPIEIWPNPATDNLHILTESTSAEVASIYNLTGSMVVNNNIEMETTFDITSLPAGSYIVQIKYTDGTISTKPFIKQ